MKPMASCISSCLFAALSFAALAACSSSSSGTSDPLAVGQQTPPQKGADVETWLKQGDYKSWHCESAPHPARAPSPHGINRICSNDLTSTFGGTGERPLGSAAVKELYDSGGTNIVGYAVYLKTKATSDTGASWYWYERVPLDSAAPHDSSGIVADGAGTANTTANSICVSCHTAAGKDAAHTPSAGSSDFVYTQVK